MISVDKKISLWKNTEFYIALGMLLFDGILIWQIFTISHGDSRMLPVFTCFIVTVSAAGQLYSVFKHRERGGNIKSVLLKKKELGVFLMLLASWLLYDVLGFYTTVFLLLVGVTLLIQAPLTPKKMIAGLIYDVVLMILIYVCFAILLGMVTPTGLII